MIMHTQAYKAGVKTTSGAFTNRTIISIISPLSGNSFHVSPHFHLRFLMFHLVFPQSLWVFPIFLVVFFTVSYFRSYPFETCSHSKIYAEKYRNTVLICVKIFAYVIHETGDFLRDTDLFTMVSLLVKK